MQNLREFLIEEMHKRRMSGREFANMVGVASSTIVRFTAEEYKKKNPAPSLDFLVKLSKATRVDLCILVAYVHPELTNTDAQSAIIGALASQLPADKQEAMLAMLRGWGIKAPHSETQ